MTSFEIPDFYCPFVSEINTHVEIAQKQTIEWAKKFQLITSESALQDFKAKKYGYIAARTFSHTDLESLVLATDWFSWLFLIDDECDKEIFKKDAHKVRTLIDRLSNILDNNKKVSLIKGTPLEASLSDLWTRLRARAPRGWAPRFRTEVKDFFEALYWETSNRENDVIPSLEEYMSKRVHSGAAYTVSNLAEITEKLTLPKKVLQNPTFQRLRYLANVTSCWSNDVFSYNKEHSHEDFHNLGIIIQHERNISLKESIAEAVMIHDRDVTEFIRLEKELPSFGPRINEQINKYLQTLRTWMRGHIDWCLYDTGRFDEQLLNQAK